MGESPKARVRSETKHTLGSYHETQKGTRPRPIRKKFRVDTRVPALLVPHMHKYDVIYTITSITVFQSDTSQDMSTQDNTPTPIQSHWTDTKYNTMQNPIQAQFCEENHSPKTQILKLRAPELPSEEIYEVREGKGGLGPLERASPSEGMPPLGGGLGGGWP